MTNGNKNALGPSEGPRAQSRMTIGNDIISIWNSDCHATLENKPEKPKKARKKRAQSDNSWLRDLVSNVCLGQFKKDVVGVRHLNCNKSVLRAFISGRQWSLERWTCEKLAQHWSSQETFYFSGNQRCRQLVRTDKRTGRKHYKYFDKTLVMIDIDCHKFGTLAGAKKFAQFLASKKCEELYGINFPGLYVETSTNGKGAHCYFVLTRNGLGADRINDLLLSRLQPLLRKILAEQGFDVELVEIKGMLPVMEWGKSEWDGSSRLVGYKSGVLAKLPRDLATPGRFKALRATTVLGSDELMQIRRYVKVKQQARRPDETVDSGEIVTEASLLEGSGKAGSSWGNGSNFGGAVFTKEILAELQAGGVYFEQAAAMADLKCQEKRRVTLEDRAIFLMVLHYLSLNPKHKDGSLPSRAVESTWRMLYGADQIERAYHRNKLTLVRNQLSDLGLIHWINSPGRKGYEYSVQAKSAMRWRLSDQALAFLGKNQAPRNKRIVEQWEAEAQKTPLEVVELERGERLTCIVPTPISLLLHLKTIIQLEPITFEVASHLATLIIRPKQLDGPVCYVSDEQWSQIPSFSDYLKEAA